MTANLLLLGYCVAVAAASLLGGFIPHWVRLTHTRMQTALSFVAGAMLGVGLLHLIPHSYFVLGSIDRTMWWALGGFLLMFFIERAFHFHHHGAPEEGESGEPAGPDHDCALGHHAHEHHTHAHGGDNSHAHGDDHEHHGGSRQVSWAAALLGLALHSLLDGVALAAAVDAEAKQYHDLGLAGLGVFLVVVLHKPFDSLTLGTLMAVGGRSARHRHLVNLSYALAVPCGALLFHFGLLSLAGDNTRIVGYALALAAGTFLCIATSDLLPELQFHTHDRFRLSAALLLGLALAGAIVFLEEHGHDHHAHEQQPPLSSSAPVTAR